jgi:hypothetical protein
VKNTKFAILIILVVRLIINSFCRVKNPTCDYRHSISHSNPSFPTLPALGELALASSPISGISRVLQLFLLHLRELFYILNGFILHSIIFNPELNPCTKWLVMTYNAGKAFIPYLAIYTIVFQHIIQMIDKLAVRVTVDFLAFVSLSVTVELFPLD